MAIEKSLKEVDDMFVRMNKDELVSKINADPEKFDYTLHMGIEDESYAFRAIWIIGNCAYKDDPRIRPHISAMIDSLKPKQDGHQREILKILEKMELDDDQEGRLFDHCMNIWEAVGKSPSVRISAFRIIARIATKYPDLYSEIEFITQPEYLESLSPGIRHSFDKIMNSLKAGN